MPDIFKATTWACPKCDDPLFEAEGYRKETALRYYVLYCMACDTVLDVRVDGEDYDIVRLYADYGH